MLGDVERREVRARMAQHAHEFLVSLRRRARIFDDDVGFADKEILDGRIDAAFLAARHRMAGDVVDVFGQDVLEMLPDVAFRAAGVGEDGAGFKVRQDFLDHRHDLQDRRTQEDDVGVLDDGFEVRGCIVDRTERDGAIHRRLVAAEARDIDFVAKLVLEAEAERAADETHTDDGKFQLAHNVRP